MSHIPDTRIEMRVKNNVLYRAIYGKWDSVAAFCRDRDLSYSGVVTLLSLKAGPWLKSGEFSSLALNVSSALGILPEELFPRTLYDRVTQHLAVIEVNSADGLPMEQMRLLEDRSTDPARVAQQAEAREVIDELLDTLTFREREILKLRYGLEDGHVYTLEECGSIFKITRDRVRQIQAKAVRKMQHPRRADRLRRASPDLKNPPLRKAHP